MYKNYSDNEDKVKLEIDSEFKIDSNVDNVHYNEIEIESKEVIDTETNDLKNKQFDEYFDVLIYEKINSDDKIQIDNKDIENKTKLNEGKRNIEIGITPEIEKSYSDDENHEYSDNESINIIEKTKKIRKKQIKYTSEERPSRFKKIELITKNTLNMERFYDTSVVNEKVLQDILDKGMSMKCNGIYKFKCGICNTPFYKKINLQRHTILTHVPVRKI